MIGNIDKSIDGLPEEEREKDPESVFENEKFPNLGKELDIHKVNKTPVFSMQKDLFQDALRWNCQKVVIKKITYKGSH